MPAGKGRLVDGAPGADVGERICSGETEWTGMFVVGRLLGTDGAPDGAPDV